MLRDGVKKRVLDNGLTVLVKENHVSPVVAIFTYVKAGYFNEPDSLVGISHLMEHMFFKGTSRRGVGEMAKETKSLGGYLNASTIYDHTLYYTVLPSRNFSQGLDIQSDALMHPVFKPEELKQETEVVIQEAKRKLDRPAAVAMERMFELAFDRHRMKRWRIGTEEGLRSLSREDFLSFHRDLYHPKNIILVVVGDVSAERALREIEKVYGDFEEGVLRKEESPAEPPQREFKYRQLRGDIQQGYLTVGFHTPEAFHPDSYAVEILAFVLGYGRSSRLYHNIKQQVNLVNTISASNYELNDLGIFMVEAIVEPQKVARAEKAIFQEIAKVRSEPVTEEELTKARNILESHYVSSMQSVSGQASMLAAYEALGDYHLAEQYLSNLYEVTYRDVLRVANRYLIMNNCSLLEYVPQGPDTEPVEKSQKRFELRHLLEKTSLELPELPTEPDYTEPFIYVRSKGVEGDIERHVFPNGLTLLVKESHQLPLVSAGFFCKGGQSDEGPENAGITGLTLRTSLKGTRNRTAAEIARQIESLGSSIHYSNDPDYLSYSINTLSKNFESGLEILTDVMTRPTFSTDELRKEKENTLNAILQEKDDMVRYPLKLFYSKLFKNHTYGLPASGEPEFIRCCTRQELQAW
ncbi:MAG: M16 family metallopeptidase, partial [Desulfobacterales bacterium]